MPTEARQASREDGRLARGCGQLKSTGACNGQFLPSLPPLPLTLPMRQRKSAQGWCLQRDSEHPGFNVKFFQPGLAYALLLLTTFPDAQAQAVLGLRLCL